MSKTRPTRRPPYRYAVTFQRRDGATTRTLRKRDRQGAKAIADALAQRHQVIRVKLWEYDDTGQPSVIATTRPGTEHICAGCLATIGPDDGRLLYEGVPFCGACAPLVEQELSDGEAT